MHRLILAHIFLLLFASTASGWGVITLCTADEQESLSSQKTNMLLTECFHRLGYTLTILPLPNRRSICEADLGTVDGNYARTEAVAASYPNLIIIPEPLGWESITAFSSDPNLKVDGWKGILHHHVAWVNGRAICEAHLSTAPQKTLVKNEKALLKFLSEGRAEVGVMGLKKGCALLQRLNITNVHPLLPPLEVAQLYLYMHKKHEELAPKVTDMLRTLKSDGTYEAIHQYLFAGAPYPKEILSNLQPCPPLQALYKQHFHPLFPHDLSQLKTNQ